MNVILNRNRFGLVIITVIIGVVVALTVPASAQEPGWTHVGTHPQASQQPTDYGKMIRTLHLTPEGRLLSGYGDYGANTGPIRITPFNTATDQFESTVHTADTEQINLYRQIGDRIYVPSLDTRSGADYAVRSSGSWSNQDKVSSLHVFDIVEYGGALWMAGSNSPNAVLWRSTDGGSSWSVALSEPPRETSFARFYFAGVYDGRLYVQARDLGGSGHPVSKVFDGSSWSDGPDLIGNGHGQSPRTFGGRMVYMYWDPGFCFGLRNFDGSSVSSGQSVYDYTISGDWLYALNCQGEVIRTQDYTTWQTVTGPLDTARSLAVVGDRAYVGTTEARIFRHTVTPPSEPPPGGGGLLGICLLGICI